MAKLSMATNRFALAPLTKPFLVALLIAAASRVFVFTYAFYFPITNEVGMPVSPSAIQPWIDFKFYLESLYLYQSLTLGELADIFLAFYDRPLGQQIGHIISGPIFPFLIYAFDYQAGNTVPMAIFYLFLSILLAAMWLRWGANRELGMIWLAVFALVPNPFWFM